MVVTRKLDEGNCSLERGADELKVLRYEGGKKPTDPMENYGDSV